MIIHQPEKISNVNEIVEDCTLVMTVTVENNNKPLYYHCRKPDESEYNKDSDGNVLNMD